MARIRLKIRRGQPHGGSIPPPGTKAIRGLQKNGIETTLYSRDGLFLGNGQFKLKLLD